MTYTVRTASDPAVLAEDLGKRYGDTPALSGLDLVVEPGNVFGSAIPIPGGDHHACLVSGIFAQSMIGTGRASRSASPPTSAAA